MIPYADDDMGATVSDWFDYADAFLLGRMSSKLSARERFNSASYRAPSPLPSQPPVETNFSVEHRPFCTAAGH